MKENFDETTTAVLPPLKVRRHITIILALFLLFTKDLKEGHIIKRNSLIDREVANFVIQAHHIPAIDVLVLTLNIEDNEDEHNYINGWNMMRLDDKIGNFAVN